MIVAPVPILGRKALFPWTIHRLRKNNITPLCLVETNKERMLCERYQLPVKQVKPMTLGQKWNIGFQWARDYNPHAVLYVGSGDWVSDNWIDFFYPYLEEYDMIGVKGIHFYHRMYRIRPYGRSLSLPEEFLGYWEGYEGDREGESCGGGRMLGRRILELMDYKPFRNENFHNMDYNMLYSVMNNGGRVFTYDGDEVKGLAVSSDLWSSMHEFNIAEEEKSVKKFLTKHFPEGLELWNVDGVYSQIESRK